jgi:hypothetical protein
VVAVNKGNMTVGNFFGRKNIYDTGSSGQSYKTFYSCNYVAIGVTQSKSKKIMPLVA